MHYSIIWSLKARLAYLNVLEYLDENWTQKEVGAFIKRTEEVTAHISQNPFLYQYSGSNSIYKCVMIKQVILFYQVQDSYIELLIFWDNRQNPI